jgi:hypothetical protein
LFDCVTLARLGRVRAAAMLPRIQRATIGQRNLMSKRAMAWNVAAPR